MFPLTQAQSQQARWLSALQCIRVQTCGWNTRRHEATHNSLRSSPLVLRRCFGVSGVDVFLQNIHIFNWSYERLRHMTKASLFKDAQTHLKYTFTNDTTFASPTEMLFFLLFVCCNEQQTISLCVWPAGDLICSQWGNKLQWKIVVLMSAGSICSAVSPLNSSWWQSWKCCFFLKTGWESPPEPIPQITDHVLEMSPNLHTPLHCTSYLTLSTELRSALLQHAAGCHTRFMWLWVWTLHMAIRHK